jgi:hypothetical protein
MKLTKRGVRIAANLAIATTLAAMLTACPPPPPGRPGPGPHAAPAPHPGPAPVPAPPPR